ncbi:MAG: hypothetical protein AB7T63_12720 [Planctomycetota bacterium]
MAAALMPRLAALWVLCGAVLKLVTGSPRDLPELVRNLPLDDVLTFQAAISAELFLGVLVLLLPRRAWPLLLALLVAFAALLVPQLDRASCGCWGSATMSPSLMLGMDLVLVGLLVAARPWRLPRESGGRARVALGAAVLAALVPWFWSFERAGATVGGSGSGPPWIDLQVDQWPGKRLAELPIADALGELAALENVDIVIWQKDCSLCADHLEKLAWQRTSEPSPGDLVLIRMRYLEEPGEQASVHRKPEGFGVHEIDAPERPEWTLTPPVHVVVVKGIVVDVRSDLADE